MDREELFRVLLESINEFSGRQYKPEDVDRSRSIIDYGVDSLNVMQILADVEEDSSLQIDLGGLREEHAQSIEALLDYLEESLPADGSAGQALRTRRR